MAEMRGVRKRRPGHGSSTKDQDNEQPNALIALDHAERTVSRKNKEHRVDDETSKRNPPRLDMLPVDLLPHIFLFLNSSRDIYNLSMCSKCIRQAITPESVVRSAVFQGGTAKQTIESVMEGIRNKCIFIPSTLRLLRLVNGTMCERMERCCGFNLVKETPSKLDKRGRVPFGGLMICNSCFRRMTCRLRIEKSWFRDHADRLLIIHVSNPQVEAATGERVGPIIHGKFIQQIESTFRTDGRRMRLLEERLEMIDQNQSQKELARADAFVDAFDIAAREFPAFERARKI